MRRILILGAGEMQVPIIEKVKARGYSAIVADYDVKAPGFEYADEKAIVSTKDYKSLLAIAKEKKIDGALTTSDYPVNIVAKIASRLNLYSMSEEVAMLCTNKGLQRNYFLSKKIKTPWFKLIKNKDELESITEFPVIIKPIDSSASRGVKRVVNYDDLTLQFSEALAYSPSATVIVEEFIDGREFSVETLSQNGKTFIVAITEKALINEEYGYFVEDSHIIPARITPVQKQLIEQEVLTAIEAMNIDNCPAHTEVKMNERGVFIIEIACRLGGDYISSDLVPLSTGVDMLGNLINISLGLEIQVKPKWKKVAAVQFINSSNYEKCRAFIESNDPHIFRSEIKDYHNRIITNSMDRMGYILLQTNTYDEMDHIFDKLK